MNVKVKQIDCLMEIADRLRPSFSQLSGLALIGVLTSDATPKLIAKIKNPGQNPETVREVRETLEALGHPYVIQDVTKIDAAKRIE